MLRRLPALCGRSTPSLRPCLTQTCTSPPNSSPISNTPSTMFSFSVKTLCCSRNDSTFWSTHGPVASSSSSAYQMDTRSLWDPIGSTTKCSSTSSFEPLMVSLSSLLSSNNSNNTQRPQTLPKTGCQMKLDSVH